MNVKVTSFWIGLLMNCGTKWNKEDKEKLDEAITNVALMFSKHQRVIKKQQSSVSCYN